MQVGSQLSRETGDTVEDYIVGKHVYGNLYGISREVALDHDFLVETMKKAAELSNATIIEVRSWVIPGKKGGVSVIVLVDESHLALHTWSEYSYATLDVYTCGEHTEPLKGFQYVVERLKPKKYTMHYVVRESRTEEMKTITPSPGDGQGATP